MSEINQNLPQTQNSHIDEDEINLLEYLYVLVKNKWIIIGMAILGFAIGHIAAIIKGPVYVADAVIAPKGARSTDVSSFSRLGMFSGMVASQLEVGGNASLSKISMLLDGRTFNSEFIKEKKIAPLLFPQLWDSTSNSWLDEKRIPSIMSVGNYVRDVLLKKEKYSNETMSIKINHEDSLVSFSVLSSYVEYLNEYLKETNKKEAEDNTKYLEEQLVGISDPLLRGKIQELIAKEVENMMIVSKDAFEVVDDVLVWKEFKEKKILPTVFSLLFAFLSFFAIIVVYIFKKNNMVNQERAYIEGIKVAMFKLPFFK